MKTIELGTVGILRIGAEVRDCAEAHSSAVRGGFGKQLGTCAAWVVAMQKVLDEGIFPRLVLEADAVACGAWPEQIGVPDEARWLWVGLSRFCYLQRGVQLRDVGYEVEGDFVMMEGMCATHGVLILNEEGARRMQWAAVHGIRWDLPIDIAVIVMCRTKKWIRHALRFPLVYQEGVNEKFTRISIDAEGMIQERLALAPPPLNT
jgi:hypothetical protein